MLEGGRLVCICDALLCFFAKSIHFVWPPSLADFNVRLHLQFIKSAQLQTDNTIQSATQTPSVNVSQYIQLRSSV